MRDYADPSEEAILRKIHVASFGRLFDSPVRGTTAEPGYKAIGRSSRTESQGNAY